MYNPFSLEKKIILVTGASSGIGRSIAIECSKMGGTLVVTGRNKERLQETFDQLVGVGHQQIIADFSKIQVSEELINVLPSLNGVVHCAGITQILPFQFVNQEKLKNIMDVNFMTPTLLSAQLVKRKKIEKGSSIVFISSVSGVFCTGLSASMYSASKGAVNGIVKGMALDLASKQIRVNSINPGVVETNIFSSGEVAQEQLDENKKQYPLKRFGKPEEIAFAAIYLLSDAAQWVTGSNFLIDGGLTLQ